VKKFFLLLIVLIFIFSLNLYSQSAQTNKTNLIENKYKYEQPSVKENSSFFFLFIKTIFILAIFLGAIYLVFKYISSKQGIFPPSKDIIKLRSTLPIGTNRFIHLIEIGTHYYLIGSSEAGINLISEIIDNESVNMIKIEASKETPVIQKVTFIQFLKEILGTLPKREKKKDNKFLNIQIERLKNLKNNLKK